MRYSRLGMTGLDVSIIGLGMEHLFSSPQNVAPVVHRAIDRGVNYIDVMIWTSEGKDAFSHALEGHRDQVILAGHLGVVPAQWAGRPAGQTSRVVRGKSRGYTSLSSSP